MKCSSIICLQNEVIRSHMCVIYFWLNITYRTFANKNRIMKTIKHSGQPRDKVVDKLKAGFAYTKNTSGFKESLLCTSHLCICRKWPGFILLNLRGEVQTFRSNVLWCIISYLSSCRKKSYCGEFVGSKEGHWKWKWSYLRNIMLLWFYGKLCCLSLPAMSVHQISCNSPMQSEQNTFLVFWAVVQLVCP